MKKIIFLLVILFIFCTSSLSQYQRYQKVVGGEYFINSDPGEGYGTWIATDTLPEVEVIVPGIDLSIGSKLYVRFKSTNGTWSGPRCIPRREHFNNSGASLTYGEYYINLDPGRGNGTPININPDGTIQPIDPPLKRGDRVFFRVKDSFNRWSPARSATYTFKYIDSAVCYVKNYSGGQSPIYPMIVNSSNDSTALFTAYRNNITPIYENDTIFVRSRTTDHFWSYWKYVIYRIVTDIQQISDIMPKEYQLSQNYPNPFNPLTTISFAIPKSSYITLKIVNILGEEIETLLSKEMQSGNYNINWDGSKYTSGMYFYRLQATDPSTSSGSTSSGYSFTQTKKLILMK